MKMKSVWNKKVDVSSSDVSFLIVVCNESNSVLAKPFPLPTT